jgi:hypothetical protein
MERTRRTRRGRNRLGRFLDKQEINKGTEKNRKKQKETGRTLFKINQKINKYIQFYQF